MFLKYFVPKENIAKILLFYLGSKLSLCLLDLDAILVFFC